MNAAMSIGFTYFEVMEKIPFAALLQIIHASQVSAARSAGEEGPVFTWANSNAKETSAVRDRLKEIKEQSW